MAVVRRLRHGQVLTGHGAVSEATLRMAGIGTERHAFTSIASAIDALGNGQCVSASVNDGNHDHNYIKEAKHSNNEHPGVPVITGR